MVLDRYVYATIQDNKTKAGNGRERPGIDEGYRGVLRISM